ncbi:collagen alpha-1(I) chain-like [Odocoileus virginianus]|uniref:Collagen alpha-1(I) chain-like n=1 Tax=Odocoileus virginianus TaxID=9874 RepID=A0ABM4GYX0_ODOVR
MCHCYRSPRLKPELSHKRSPCHEKPLHYNQRKPAPLLRFSGTNEAARGRRTDAGARGTRGAAARPGPSGGSAGSPGRARRLPARAPRRRRGREPALGRGSHGRGRASPAREKGRGTWRVTWARATARGFRSPAAARPSARRAPARSSPPAPRRPGQAARSSAPRRCPRGPGRLRAPGPPRGRAGAEGCPSHGAPGSPHPLPLPGRPRSRGEGGKGASGGQRAATNAGSATRAAPLPQRRWRRRRPGPCCCCQLVGRTLSMRARRPHPESTGFCEIYTATTLLILTSLISSSVPPLLDDSGLALLTSCLTSEDTSQA